MRAAFFTALALGLPAGVAPGPLLTLVITHTLRHGLREGIKVAAAPLITDPPIAVLCAWVLSGATAAAMLPWLSIGGGLFVAWLGVTTWRASADEDAVGAAAGPRSLRDGIVVNALSPHPYLFWVTVGGPLIVKFGDPSPAPALLFLAVFLLMVAVGKAAMAVMVEQSRGWLHGRGYRWLLRAMGALLVIMGCWLVVEGVQGAGA